MYYQWNFSHFAAAAAKSFQSCLTLCDPIDGSPPGSPVPGILQTRTLEWVAISFSKAWKSKVKVKSCPILCDPPGSSVHGIFQAVLLGTWVPLPYCSPPGCPFPIKSLALSAHVSPQTLPFWVVDKSPVSGPGRGPPSCNKWQLWRAFFFAETDILTTRGTQGPACLPMDQTMWSPPDADNWPECPDR